jgi:hypothetical protein
VRAGELKGDKVLGGSTFDGIGKRTAFDEFSESVLFSRWASWRRFGAAI